MSDKGLKDKIAGKAKEVAGDVTGDNKLKAEGMAQQAVGKAKEVAGDIKEKAQEVAKDVKDKLDNK